MLEWKGIFLGIYGQLGYLFMEGVPSGDALMSGIRKLDMIAGELTGMTELSFGNRFHSFFLLSLYVLAFYKL